MAEGKKGVLRDIAEHMMDYRWGYLKKITILDYVQNRWFTRKLSREKQLIIFDRNS
jgi:hypothetical protein